MSSTRSGAPAEGAAGCAAATPVTSNTLVCTTCGVSTQVDLDASRLLERSIRSSLGAEIVSHKVELRGECAVCRALAIPRAAWGEA